MDMKTETRTVEGFEVTITQMPASRALPLLPEVAQIVGAVFGAGHGLEAEVGAVLASSGMNGTRLTALVQELLATASVQVQGKHVALSDRRAIDIVFSGRIKALLAAAWFSVQLNYADFFDDASGTPSDPAPSTAG